MKKNRLVLLACTLPLLALSSCSGETSLKGFDIDLAKACSLKLNVEADFQLINWDNKEIELNAKNIDVIWNGFTITDERKASLCFSVPYMENKQVVITKKTFNDTIDKDDKYQVAVEAGSAGSDTFDDNEMFKSSTKIETTDQVSALTEVLSGTSDVAIIDSVMAGYYLSSSSSYGDKLMIQEAYNFASEDYGIGFRKDDLAFAAKVNGALTTLYTEGTTLNIANTYGLSKEIKEPETFTSFADIDDTSSWDYISKKGKITIGYTIFAPIAFKAQK